MPKTQKPPAAKGGRRGKHREKRHKMLEAKPHWLTREAPEGEYLVDVVSVELFLRGAVAPAGGQDEFIKTVREDVSLAGQFAAMRARIHLVRRPEMRRLTKRLFSDLRDIQSRI